jgi:prepilin-type N-terminal cleavage/methylation domain-containing protein
MVEGRRQGPTEMNRNQSESGFTLVEVLVATIISAIIVGGIAGILIVTLESYPSSAARISLSDNAQLLSTWLVPDAQSAAWNSQGIDMSPALTDIPGCTVSLPPSTNVVTLSWSDYDTGITFAAAYRQVGSELMRYYCKAGNLLSTTVVGRNIKTGGATASQTVDSLKVAVQTLDLVNGSGSGYNFSVSASRQTPALRIYPVPDLTPSFITDPDSAVSGTALPNAQVNLTISDQNSPPDTFTVAQTPADSGGNWSVNLAPVNWSALRFGDLITFTATSTDLAGHTSTAITTSVKPLIPLVSTYPGTNNPTNKVSVNFLITFPEPVTGGLDSTHITIIGPGNTNISIDQFPQSVPCLATAPPGSVCFEDFLTGGLDMTNDAGDGPITLTVGAHVVQDAAGNPNLPSVPYTIYWDLNLPTVTPLPPNPTSTQPVTFLVAFPHALTAGLHQNGDQLTVTAPPADLAVLQKDVEPVVPCPASAPVGSTTCFTVAISNLPTTPAADAPITVQVNPNVVTDKPPPAYAGPRQAYGGPNLASQPSAPITWLTTFTIAETPGPGAMTTFSGVAGPAPVTLNICNDAACSVPAPQPPVTVDATGHWSATVFTSVLAGNQYAEATQTNAAGQPESVFTKLGP